MTRSAASSLQNLSNPCNNSKFNVTGFNSVACTISATCCSNGTTIQASAGIGATCSLPYSISAKGTFKSSSVIVNTNGNGTYSGGPLAGQSFSLVGSDEKRCDGTETIVAPIGLVYPC